MFYREAAPSDFFRNIVLSFWEFTVSQKADAPLDHEIFPDGCISLFYHRNENVKFERLFFSGLLLETFVTPVYAGDVYWGMRLSPAACAAVLRSEPAVYQQVSGFDAAVLPHLTDGLLEKFGECRTFADAAIVYEDRLKSLNLDENSFDSKVAEAVRAIEETSGEIKIGALAEHLNLSTRQLERRFKQSSGLTPKQFARTRRFRATAVDLVENEKINWANRAAEMGFTDQAHLTREFVSVSKRSPNSFARKVKQIEHGKLVK